MLHLLVVYDHNEHLHEVSRSNLLVERRRTFVHQHVQQAQRQEHDLRFVRKDALSNLEGRRLPATRISLRTRTYKSEV